ncbi:MAG TPA: hypothetical protein VEG60_13780 [Candidatus Binatia bacterium]|nr:hypothetical protein [Candidatus Binatia bacterium]
MAKSAFLLKSLFLSSALLSTLPSVESQEMISSIPTDTTAYCHLEFPAMHEGSLSWHPPVLDPLTGNIVDFYGPCDYDLLDSEEIRVQRRVLLRDHFNDGVGEDFRFFP